MQVQEVLLRAMGKRITWWQAAEILGMSCRSLRRGKPSPRRVPVGVGEEVLRLYQEEYFDCNVRHFHEKLRDQHGLRLSYTWVKLALQGAGLVRTRRKRGPHRKRRPRRPLPGMLLHLDGSRHQWFQDERWYDLLVILDDASSEIYYAQLVEEESTRTVLAAIREVVEQKLPALLAEVLSFEERLGDDAQQGFTRLLGRASTALDLISQACALVLDPTGDHGLTAEFVQEHASTARQLRILQAQLRLNGARDFLSRLFPALGTAPEVPALRETQPVEGPAMTTVPLPGPASAAASPTPGSLPPSVGSSSSAARPAKLDDSSPWDNSL